MTSGPNRRLCELTASEFVSLWRRNRDQYDDLADAPNYHQEFVAGSVDAKGAAEALLALEGLHGTHSEFFSAFPYHWASSAAVYDLPVEATFQVRLFELLVSFWRQRPNVPVASGFGNLAVREIVAPTTFQGTPRAVDLEGHGFILMPLGWFDTAQFATLAFRRHFEGDAAAVLGLVLESIVRTIADRCVQELTLGPVLTFPTNGGRTA